MQDLLTTARLRLIAARAEILLPPENVQKSTRSASILPKAVAEKPAKKEARKAS